jgi:hypothetical protein
MWVPLIISASSYAAGLVHLDPWAWALVLAFSFRGQYRLARQPVPVSYEASVHCLNLELLKASQLCEGGECDVQFCHI